jgi:Uma2 family endonuclease
MAAAITATKPRPISIERYLVRSNLRPDVDFVDGRLVARNIGEFDHADVVGELLFRLASKEEAWSIIGLISVRVRVSATRVRVPDLCVLDAKLDHEQVIDHPPMLCIEVLGSEDTVTAMRERVQDFLDMGVPEVWLFNPWTRTAYVCTNEAMAEYRQGALRLAGSQVELDVEAVFATLDD